MSGLEIVLFDIKRLCCLTKRSVSPVNIGVLSLKHQRGKHRIFVSTLAYTLMKCVSTISMIIFVVIRILTIEIVREGTVEFLK